jgi:hypothetical protein
VRYSERPEFPYDPTVFKLSDTQTAMRIYDEAVRKHSPRPKPFFFEIDRKEEHLDPLWNTPVSGRERVDRKFEMACINMHPKNDWTMTKVGLTPQRRDDFILSHLSLIRLDYFPNRGDLVLFNGYRYMVIHVEIPAEAYWQQTNVWLGLTVRCIIPPDGDGKPIIPTADELHQLTLPIVPKTAVQSPPDVPGSPVV